MPASQDHPMELFRQGVHALKAGNKDLAADLLIKSLQRDPRNEQAWLWLSGAVHSNEERRECLERVLELNPHNMAAQHGLTKLGVALPLQVSTGSTASTIPHSAPSALSGSSHESVTAAPVMSATAPAEAIVSALPSGIVATPPLSLSRTTSTQPAPTMENETATQFVIELFGKHRSREEIARGLCAQHAMTWKEAEQFIDSVQAGHGRKIATRQAPFFVVLGVIGIIGGIWLLGYGSYRVYFQLTYLTIPDLRAIYYALGGAVAGLGMLLGSIIGLWQTIVAMFKG